MKIIKRDGTHVDFDNSKIFNALCKCRDAVNPLISNETLYKITESVTKKIRNLGDVHVEDIQDAVEFELMHAKLFAMAKAYIEYRHLHKIRRDGLNDLMSTCREILFSDSAGVDSKRSNANINSDASMGIMLNLGAETAKFFNNTCVLPAKFADAHREKFIHIHDQDFSMITFNCCQIDTPKLLAGGFSTGHGFLREPNSIRSAAALACIAVQSNQNDMFGGQSLNGFDFAMARYVRKSFHKTLRLEIERACTYANRRLLDSDVVDRCHFHELNDEKFFDDPSVGWLTLVIEDTELAKKIYASACHIVEAMREIMQLLGMVSVVVEHVIEKSESFFRR